MVAPKRLLCLCLLTLICNFGFALSAARADNADIPPSFKRLYDDLLGQKQRWLGYKADHVRVLNEMEVLVKQLDDRLRSNCGSSENVVSARSALIDRINQVEGSLDRIEHELMDIDADLAWTEAKMKEYACR